MEGKPVPAVQSKQVYLDLKPIQQHRPFSKSYTLFEEG